MMTHMITLPVTVSPTHQSALMSAVDKLIDDGWHVTSGGGPQVSLKRKKPTGHRFWDIVYTGRRTIEMMILSVDDEGRIHRHWSHVAR